MIITAQLSYTFDIAPSADVDTPALQMSGANDWFIQVTPTQAPAGSTPKIWGLVSLDGGTVYSGKNRMSVNFYDDLNVATVRYADLMRDTTNLELVHLAPTMKLTLFNQAGATANWQGTVIFVAVRIP